MPHLASSVLPIRVVIRHLVRDRARLAMTVLGVSFAVFLMVFQGSLLVGFIAASQQVIHAARGDVWILPRGVTCFDFAATLPRSFGDLARGVRGVTSARPMVAAFTTLQRGDGHRRAVLIVGSDAERLPDTAAVDASAAGLLGVTSTPAHVEVAGHRAVITDLTAEFGGFLGSPYVFTGVTEARRWTRTPDDVVSYWVLSLEPEARAPVVVAALRDRLPDADVLTSADFASQSAKFWLIQTGAGGAILTAGLLGFLVGLAIVSQTMYANTMDHLDDFATLKALGASDATIRRFVMSQAILIGLAGGAVGLLLTWPLTALARQVLVSWIDTRWWLAAGGVAAGLLMCALASLASVGRAVRVEPAEALRS